MKNKKIEDNIILSDIYGIKMSIYYVGSITMWL